MMDDKGRDSDKKVRGIESMETLKEAIGKIAILRFAFEGAESVDFDRFLPDVCKGASEILGITLSELEGVSQVLENVLQEFRTIRAKPRHYDALVKAGVLDYPPLQAFEGIEDRKHERKKVLIGVSCSWEPKRRFFLEGYISDVSKSGCQILGDMTQCIGRNIFLSFRIPWTGGEIQARARVVRCEATEKGSRSGLRFMDLDPENQERLDALVGSLTEGKLIGSIIGEESQRI